MATYKFTTPGKFQKDSGVVHGSLNRSSNDFIELETTGSISYRIGPYTGQIIPGTDTVIIDGVTSALTGEALQDAIIAVFPSTNSGSGGSGGGTVSDYANPALAAQAGLSDGDAYRTGDVSKNLQPALVLNTTDTGLDHLAFTSFMYPNRLDIFVDWGDGTTDFFPGDVFGYTEITHKVYSAPGDYIIKFYLDQTQVTELDINLNDNPAWTSKINSISTFQHFTNLHTLYVNYAHMDSFVNTLPDSLVFLDLGRNSITSVDGIVFNAKLEQFFIYTNSLTNVDAVFEIMVNSGVFTYLDAGQNQITSVDASLIYPQIKILKLYNNQLSVTNVSEILNRLDSNGETNGEISLNDQVPPAIPNEDGQTAKTNLQGKGWSISVDV